MAGIDLDNPTIRTDIISLLDNDKYWEILKSIYSMIDSTAQYNFALVRECEKKNIPFMDLERIAYPFRHFLFLFMLKRITTKELKNDLESLNHPNADKLSVFVGDVYQTHKELLNRLLQTQIVLSHTDKSILNDLGIIACSTKMKIDDQEEILPFILLDIGDETYRCSKKDVEFIIEELNKVITEV